MQLRAAFVAQFAVAKQALALLNAWVFLSIIQIFQLIYVVLALRLSFLHVNIGQHGLNDAYRFLETRRVLMIWWRVSENLFEKKRVFDQS